jgi:hypothetical protein
MARLILSLIVAVALLSAASASDWGWVLSAAGTLTFSDPNGGKAIPIPMLVAGSSITGETVSLRQDWNRRSVDGSKTLSFNVSTKGTADWAGQYWDLTFIATDTQYRNFFSQFGAGLYEYEHGEREEHSVTVESQVLQCTSSGSVLPACQGVAQMQCKGSTKIGDWPVNIAYSASYTYCGHW